MKIAILDGFSEAPLDPVIEELRALGAEITDIASSDCDVIFCASIFKIGKALEVQAAFPNIPFVSYCWDFYEWVLTRPRENELPWRQYIEVLQKSTEVWFPSIASSIFACIEFGLSARIVPCHVPVYDYEPVSDERFVLNPLRVLPDDFVGVVEEICAKYSIPCKTPNHTLTREEFTKELATCSFVVSPYAEASTGGLSIIEALWLGKPVLANNGIRCGAHEYLGGFGTYFSVREDLEKTILNMWHNTPRIDRERARAYVSEHFSAPVIAKLMLKEWKELCARYRNS